MDDLRAFLKARLDEDEHAAQRAASLCGCHPDAPSWTFDDEATDGRILVADDPHPQVKRKLNRRWSSTYDGLFMAQHIVRQNPARVLREVEAKREILRLHGSMAIVPGHPMFNDAHLTRDPMTICRSCEPETMWRREKSWPCRTLRALAVPYADHENYREEWKP